MKSRFYFAFALAIPAGLLACDDVSKAVLDTGPVGAGIDGELCSEAIPTGADVTTGIEVYNAVFDAVWACSGSSVTVNASGSLVFVESGAAVTVNPGYAEIYVLSGATVTANGGSADVYYEPGATVTINAPDAAGIRCGSIELDSSAVADGC